MALPLARRVALLLVACTPLASSQEVHWSQSGVTVGGYAGLELSEDVSGDGIAELAVGAPEEPRG